MALVVGVLAAIGVGGVAVAARGHRAARQATGDPAAALIARLSVLRRPQSSADLLPAGVQVIGATGGTLIPSLTRLMLSLPGVSLYLVVSTPPASALSLWNPGLGDQVSLVSVNSRHAVERPPFPAVELADAFEVSLAAAAPSTAYALGRGYEVGIVPDGVARVRWTFTDRAGKARSVVDPQVTNNVAWAPVQPNAWFLLKATWYTADGSVIPTSDSALVAATRARQDVIRAQLIRQDGRAQYRVPAAVLADFAVFSVVSRTGVKIDGVTLSHPRLSALPLAILKITRAQRPQGPGQVDPEDMRQATTNAGDSVWITPGQDGICIFALSAPTSPSPLAGLGSGSFGACSGSIASAQADGSAVSSCCTNGYIIHYGVLPISRPTLTISTGRHKSITIRPPDGVYIYRTRNRH